MKGSFLFLIQPVKCSGNRNAEYEENTFEIHKIKRNTM